MFLSVEWAKRWLPAVFLLLSLFLPWWTKIGLFSTCFGRTYYFRPFESFTLSFLWVDRADFLVAEGGGQAWYRVEFSYTPFLLFVSALILFGGLFGLSNRRETRTLGGLLGIGSFIFYLIWRLFFPVWYEEYVGGKNFYFGMGEYHVSHGYEEAVWFLSIGFYLAVIGSLLLLVLSIRKSTETPKESIFPSIEGVKEFVFLGIVWVKRRLPAVLLLLSLLLPWWTMVSIYEREFAFWYQPEHLPHYYRGVSFSLSFPWEPNLEIRSVSGYSAEWDVIFYEIPYFCFVSALVVIAGLCGLSSKSRTRSLAGLLGIIGVISYLILVFPKSSSHDFPYFGILRVTQNLVYWNEVETSIWLHSIGFYLAIVSSLLLLLPLIRTLIERLRKRLQSSQLQPNIFSEETSESQAR